MKKYSKREFIITEDEAIVISKVFKRLIQCGYVVADSFQTICKYCDKLIFLKDFGYGWHPYDNDSDAHECKQGKEFFKQQKKLNKEKEKFEERMFNDYVGATKKKHKVK